MHDPWSWEAGKTLEECGVKVGALESWDLGLELGLGRVWIRVGVGVGERLGWLLCSGYGWGWVLWLVLGLELKKHCC